MSGKTLVVVMSVVFGSAGPVLGDDIVLQGSVRMAPDAKVVRLADICTLEGPRAEALADLVIAQVVDPDLVLEITIHQVRNLLSEAGVHWGKIQLGGRRVIVRPSRAVGVNPPLAMAALSIDGTPTTTQPVPSAVDQPANQLIKQTTLRGAIARTIVAGLLADPKRLRLIFEERDDAFLSGPEDAYRYEIQPLSSLDSDRIELVVRAWSEGRIEQRRSLTVRLLIECAVVLPRKDLGRGQKLRDEDLTVEPRWLTATQSHAMVTRVGAVGRVTATRLRAGEAIRRQHLEREILIQRGDRVRVRCLVGGVVISLEAKARADGAEGDRVELRKLGERDTFFGTVTGRGAAILDLSRK